MILSIITINCNNATGLAKTIQSIVKHKNNDIEYLVIDGGSSDESVEVIKKYADYIDYWISEPDFGIYNAMNKGIKWAKGDNVLFINSGDIINDKANMSGILSYVSNDDIVYFNLEIRNTQTENSYIKTYPSKLDFKYFLEDSLPHTASFIKRKSLIEYGYYSENLKIVSDWAFFMDAIIKYGCSYKYVNKTFSAFYDDGISSKISNRTLLWEERHAHILSEYPLYSSLYNEWMQNKQELYKLKTSKSIHILKQMGFLKWLRL
ncbi:MAG: glycosyltransferase family 2 protein [Dysgonomonas sp.]